MSRQFILFLRNLPQLKTHLQPDLISGGFFVCIFRQSNHPRMALVSLAHIWKTHFSLQRHFAPIAHLTALNDSKVLEYKKQILSLNPL